MNEAESTPLERQAPDGVTFALHDRMALMGRAPLTVAVFNSNDDVVEMLRIALEMEDFVAVSMHMDEVRRGRFTLIDFVREHNPEVIIYDLVPPYDHSWRFLEHLRATPEMQGRAWVVTSTNPQRASELGRSDETVLEIIGKPYDIARIVQAVKEAAARHGQRSGPAEPRPPM
jgi:DNA-binding NarL/FixJ family response regulator